MTNDTGHEIVTSLQYSAWLMNVPFNDKAHKRANTLTISSSTTVAEVVNDACQVFSDDPGQNKSIFSDNCFPTRETKTLDEILTERLHMKQETDIRESGSEEAYLTTVASRTTRILIWK